MFEKGDFVYDNYYGIGRVLEVDSIDYKDRPIRVYYNRRDITDYYMPDGKMFKDDKRISLIRVGDKNVFSKSKTNKSR